MSARGTPPRLTRLVELLDPQIDPDGSGGHQKTWTPLGQLWAEIHALTGRSARQGGTEVSLQRYRITVRSAPYGHPARPRPDQRFGEGERRFVIHAVADADTEGQYLTCFATEEVVT